MKTFEFETTLSVEEYLKGEEDEDIDIAFEDSEGDIKGAIKDAKDEIRDLMGIKRLPRGLKFSAKFLEFDSGNISHAGAYFNVEVAGPDNFIDELERKYKEEWGEVED